MAAVDLSQLDPTSSQRLAEAIDHLNAYYAQTGLAASVRQAGSGLALTWAGATEAIRVQTGGFVFWLADRFINPYAVMFWGTLHLRPLAALDGMNADAATSLFLRWDRATGQPTRRRSANEVGAVLAHELSHTWQQWRSRKLWFALSYLPSRVLGDPYEREAKANENQFETMFP